MKNTDHKKLPSLLVLEEKFKYNPISGVLCNKETQKPIGSITKQGYLRTSIDNEEFFVHRICFKMYHRRDPGKKIVDHINGEKADNTIFNLRACSYRSNACNNKKRRDAGIIPKPSKKACAYWTEPVKAR